MIMSNGVVAVASGANFSLFLESDGSLWTMGDNQWGQFGNRDVGRKREHTADDRSLGNGVTSIAGGNDHTLFIMNGGSLWGMGHDLLGPLGDSNFSSDSRLPRNKRCLAA